MTRLIDADALAYEREPVPTADAVRPTADVARRHVAGLKETVAG